MTVMIAISVFNAQAERLEQQAMLEAEALRQQEEAQRLLLQQAEEEEERLRAQEEETLRVKELEEEHLRALRRQESDDLRRKQEIEAEAGQLRQAELENERLMRELHEQQDLHLRQAEELENQRLKAVAEAEELHKQMLDLQAQEEAAIKHAAELAIKEAKELELQRIAEQQARELHEWQAQVEEMAVTACLFAYEQVIQESIDVSVATALRGDSAFEVNPETWLAKPTIQAMYAHARKARANQRLRYKRICMRVFKQYLAVKRIKHRYVRLMKSYYWSEYRNAFARQRLRTAMCERIQGVARKYLIRKSNALIRRANIRGKEFYESKLRAQAKDSLKFWKYLAVTNLKAKNTIFQLKDRRFILTFYTWLHTYKQHKKDRLQTHKEREDASAIIQSAARVLFARNVVKRIYAQRSMAYAMRIAVAKRRVRRMRVYRRRLEDCEQSLQTLRSKAMRRHLFKRWTSVNNIGRACAIATHTIHESHRRTVMKRWKLFTFVKVQQRNAAATVIQAAARRRIVLRIVFDFYKWRRGLVLAQGLVRKNLMMRVFAVSIFIYRNARRIQKTFRGDLMFCCVYSFVNKCSLLAQALECVLA
jgi:chemotaxis protein histidine kinase CheA